MNLNLNIYFIFAKVLYIKYTLIGRSCRQLEKTKIRKTIQWKCLLLPSDIKSKNKIIKYSMLSKGAVSNTECNSLQLTKDCIAHYTITIKNKKRNRLWIQEWYSTNGKQIGRNKGREKKNKSLERIKERKEWLYSHSY